MAADLHKFLFKSKFMRKTDSFTPFILCITVLSLLIVLSAAKDCSDLCKNGSCSKLDGECLCDPGWSGKNCEYCSGRVRLWNNSGVISDGPGNYSEDNQCTWLIDPERSNASIRLYLSHFATECSWDHLYIYDGGSIYDPLLAVFSGMVVQDRYKISNTHELVAHSGKALLHFYSDAAYNLTGFSIKYKVDGCPSLLPGKDCSGKGVCIEGRCTCDGGWTGVSCSVHICPLNCSGNGQCLMEQHRCVCQAGFTGSDCSQKMDNGWWDFVAWSQTSNSIAENLNEIASEEVLERASHSVVVINDLAWVIGGYSFKQIPFIALYNISDNAVQIINSPSKRSPTPRYGHSCVTFNDTIYMFGGMLEDGRQSSELWHFEPTSLIWELITDMHYEPLLGPLDQPPTKPRRNARSDKKMDRLQAFEDTLPFSSNTSESCSNSARNLCTPFATVGHAAVVVRNSFMLVLLGYSSKYGSLNLVQEFHFETNTWKIVETQGALIDGTYGHSAVWDPESLLVFVHGGLRSAYSNSVVSDLITYDPFKHKWLMMKPAPVPRFLHSSVLLPGLMLVYGGNTHNDTAYSYGAKCYSADMLAYDIRCQTWKKLADVPDLGVENSRYGHAAVRWKDSMVIIGGFNGRMLGSVLRYNLGRCETLNTSASCRSEYPGRKCAWNVVLERCEEMPHGEAPHELCLTSTPVPPATRANLCSRETSCHSCLHSIHDCQWCGNECTSKCSNYLFLVDSLENCPDRRYQWCKSVRTCEMCLANSPLCSWTNRECSYVSKLTALDLFASKNANKAEKLENFMRQALALRQSAPEVSENQTTAAVVDNSATHTCAPTCDQRTSCSNCTQGACMWCFNQQRCVSNDSYLISFPYGQCREWTTETAKCLHSQQGVSKCTYHQTCENCLGDIACGWCEHKSWTGTGVCLDGGQSGTVHPATKELRSWMCPKDRWFFTSCPSCSCNGHSHCLNESECVQPCANNTQGAHCSTCKETFYGQPINGGLCKSCECNGHGDTCEHATGKCHCDTKGVTGDQCERCDTQNNYYGIPTRGGSCFYDLQIDYQFTFNLSKQEDLHIRQINFYNIPSKPDVDTDFDIQCSKDARIMISAKQVGQPEVSIMQNFTGKGLRRRFSASDYVFGSLDNNTTFHVYVLNFVPPIEIVISFSQHPKLDLVQFFSIFSLCFMVLLLMAFVLWKIKQKYDLYTRRQRLVEEMEAMASRPFQTIVLELQRLDEETPKLANGSDAPKAETPKTAPAKTALNGSGASKKNCNGNVHAEMLHSVGSPVTSKHNDPSPVSLEPCAGNKAAVLSLIIQLPNGGSRYTPHGHPGGLAVASALVSLGSPRKGSAEVTSNTKEIPRPNKHKMKKSHATSL